MAISVASPKALLTDKGHDGDRLREGLLIRGLLPIIPPRPNLGQDHVALLCDLFPDKVSMYLDPARMSINAARVGNCLTMLKSKLAPADCTRCAGIKVHRSRAAAHAAIRKSETHQRRKGNPC